MTTENKYELFELLKGPHPMKFLCEKYNEYKGRNCFKDFFDNGDCEPHEIDWFYNCMFPHVYDGDWYSVQCSIRDSYDKDEDIYPEVEFWLDVSLDPKHFTRYKFDRPLPLIDEVRKTYRIKTISEFIKVMDEWPKFAKKSLKIIEKNRLEWLELFTPKRKELYEYMEGMEYDITSSKNNILTWTEYKNGI